LGVVPGFLCGICSLISLGISALISLIDLYLRKWADAIYTAGSTVLGIFDGAKGIFKGDSLGEVIAREYMFITKRADEIWKIVGTGLYRLQKVKFIPTALRERLMEKTDYIVAAGTTVVNGLSSLGEYFADGGV
jgi:hypothetical protein